MVRGAQRRRRGRGECPTPRQCVLEGEAEPDRAARRPGFERGPASAPAACSKATGPRRAGLSWSRAGRKPTRRVAAERQEGRRAGRSRRRGRADRPGVCFARRRRRVARKGVGSGFEHESRLPLGLRLGPAPVRGADRAPHLPAPALPRLAAARRDRSRASAPRVELAAPDRRRGSRLCRALRRPEAAAGGARHRSAVRAGTAPRRRRLLRCAAARSRAHVPSPERGGPRARHVRRAPRDDARDRDRPTATRRGPTRSACSPTTTSSRTPSAGSPSGSRTAQCAGRARSSGRSSTAAG